MNDIFNAYSHVIATAIVLLSVILFLWLLLLANGLFKNPLKICNKSIIGAVSKLELLKLDLSENRYNKRTDTYLFLAKDKIDLLNRYVRQFNYENDDDRASSLSGKIQSINISLAILKKVYFQRGSKDALEILGTVINDLDQIREVINNLLAEELKYNNYKKK